MTDDDVSPGAAQVLRCDHAWIGGAMRDDVTITIRDEVVADIAVGHDPAGHDPVDDDPTPVPAIHVPGVTLPGLVNAHSHAFHRVLRGRTQDPVAATDGRRGSFWTWREQMYRVAAVLDPDRYHDLARAVFAEMALAGITCVGEFHYLHHQADGTAYADPNAMGEAVAVAATDAGIRLTLLDTIYLTGEVGATVDEPALDPVQRRFSDGDVASWARRVDALAEGDQRRIGAAIHSVRAVPPAAMAAVAAVTVGTASGPGRVVHAHVSEQPRENRSSRDHHGCSPTRVLADAGVVTDRFTAVHGTWLDDDDIGLLGDNGATVCACPTTERDLADGVVDGVALSRAGVGLALGSDQHGVIDLFEEARALEVDQRVATGARGLHPPEELLDAATFGGAHSLGWPELGRLEVGAPADVAVVGLDSVRLAGVRRTDLVAGMVFAATAADVTDVMVAGRWIVRRGRHVDLDVADSLSRAIAAIDEPAGTRP